ncbi:Parvovirus coat protein VP1-like protein [Lysinibacillus sp. NPDC093197]|uniref:Parvovirus coat protein VP1-like protein n=1 Tax=Lysinibacillus sp. NPDC093197 TaxID=3364132 RepID=UPI00381241BB
MNRHRRLRFCYPGYKYCGPGCSGPGSPTNAVDSCCKKHDDCYSKYGRTKNCDELFQQCLLAQMNTNSKMGRDARLFYKVFDLRNNFF